MRVFFVAACLPACVRASGHGVLRFVFLHGLSFERMFVFLLFFLVSTSCHCVFLFVCSVFWSDKTCICFVWRLVFWSVSVHQAMVFAFLFYTD